MWTTYRHWLSGYGITENLNSDGDHRTGWELPKDIPIRSCDETDIFYKCGLYNDDDNNNICIVPYST